jgi:hypothetical protein
VPQNRSGRRGKEKHLAPARNPTPAVHPYARRDATDTAVIRTECTPPHIYFSIDFSLQLLHLCVPVPTNITLLQFGLYEENDLPVATGPQNGPQGKHLRIVNYGPLPGNGPIKRKHYPFVGPRHGSVPKKN